jgi:tRNA G37 N-methylase Trm5
MDSLIDAVVYLFAGIGYIAVRWQVTDCVVRWIERMR